MNGFCSGGLTTGQRDAVFSELVAALELSASQAVIPDLLVCTGRYASSADGHLSRSTKFQPRLLRSVAYRRALLFGSTPPHQATLFGPGARRRLSRYSAGFRLSADLDYFLQLSHYPSLCVQCLDLEVVHMADTGISGQQTQRRLYEVARAYRRAFAWRWWFPFLARYVKRVVSLFGHR